MFVLGIELLQLLIYLGMELVFTTQKGNGNVMGLFEVFLGYFELVLLPGVHPNDEVAFDLDLHCFLKGFAFRIHLPYLHVVVVLLDFSQRQSAVLRRVF